jgi:DNA-binding response OmpR family regulator
MRILLVDDEIELSSMISRILQRSGFSDVTSVSTPEEAIEYIEKNKPDLAFLDINLNAGMTGLDVLRRVRQTAPEVQVCMSSAYREEHEQESLSVGAKWFLKKPASIQDFIAVARSV